MGKGWGWSGGVESIKGVIIRVKLNNVNIPKANLTLESDNELRMIAKDASLHVSANWAYREQPWPHISDSGTCDISVGGLSLGMLFDISTDIPKKKSSMHVKNCNLNVGKLSVKFHGGASWLYNLFSKEIERELRSSLGDKVCKSAEQLIDSKANKALDALAGMIKGFEGGT
ncbi:predicted protein [Nematostella vectensis]|uniref:Lipid-binding serum glycoprotein N-terminal domain-containing protein n=1 Tax=Nematostella vectensis TaxID=45351 RepID=A7RVS9_NEMVE|nr:predicted protein [Nematostella vectensis]|eukprot:XP_001636503.1 predicted protein [Nematostella vectensis]